LPAGKKREVLIALPWDLINNAWTVHPQLYILHLFSASRFLLLFSTITNFIAVFPSSPRPNSFQFLKERQQQGSVSPSPLSILFFLLARRYHFVFTRVHLVSVMLSGAHPSSDRPGRSELAASRPESDMRILIWL
jgi:hypothetical protein